LAKGNEERQLAEAKSPEEGFLQGGEGGMLR